MWVAGWVREGGLGLGGWVDGAGWMGLVGWMGLDGWGWWEGAGRMGPGAGRVGLGVVPSEGAALCRRCDARGARGGVWWGVAPRGCGWWGVVVRAVAGWRRRVVGGGGEAGATGGR